MRPIIAAAGLLIAFTSHGFAAEPQHRLVIQVDQNDRRTMDFALNNVTDVIEHYRGLDQTVAVEIMACGPGLHMLRIDTSPVKERIKQIRETASPSRIQFSACNNTKQSMEKKEGHLLENAARNNDCALGRGAAIGVAGTGLELCAAVING
jgi:intracellular sulfur oxidation DsrE/DsrF family protein